MLARLGLELPTEAQWEYAARGGTATPWYTGAAPISLRGHANLRDATARRSDGRRASGQYELWLNDGYAGLAPVGSFRPNPFGLHDVIGNVSEWCRDWFQVYECPVRPGTGERIPVDAGPMRRVLRGGNRGRCTLAASRHASTEPGDRGGGADFAPGRCEGRRRGGLAPSAIGRSMGSSRDALLRAGPKKIPTPSKRQAHDRRPRCRSAGPERLINAEMPIPIATPMKPQGCSTSPLRSGTGRRCRDGEPSAFRTPISRVRR